MTRSLAFKLVLAFLLVSITGAALNTLFARWVTFREFDRLVLERVQTDFLADITAYYQANGSWQGAWQSFRKPGALPAPPSQPGQQPPPLPGGQVRQQAPRSSYVFALADLDGHLVLPAGPYQLRDRVPAETLAQGIEVEVDGQVVGVALPTGQAPELSPQEMQYLARTTRSSLYAALAAILVALTLGVFLARTLTLPVRELTAATRALAQGEMEQQVPVRSRDELGELAVSFNQMSADLARAVELRRQMTADIAHDLRTPLTVMAGYLEALRDGVLQPSPERFETMHQEARHLRRLVEDLRTLSLADAGELTLNREPVSPGSMVEQAAAACQHQAKQQGIELKVDVAPNLPDVSVDPDRFAQVLGNLVSNALRHTPAAGQIWLVAARENLRVLLIVQDTGAGIAPDDLPHVFDRSYRGDEARVGDRGESGLGLTIARSLVELHGGTISVESSLGQGTTFTIVLPVGEDRTAAKKQNGIFGANSHDWQSEELMDKQKPEQAGTEAGEVKTCPACGGTWSATRRHCIACGASLEGVPARVVEERASREKLDLGWLDVLSPDSS
jgi:two-component system sensor histidine kinase BaeS